MPTKQDLGTLYGFFPPHRDLFIWKARPEGPQTKSWWGREMTWLCQKHNKVINSVWRKMAIYKCDRRSGLESAERDLNPRRQDFHVHCSNHLVTLPPHFRYCVWVLKFYLTIKRSCFFSSVIDTRLPSQGEKKAWTEESQKEVCLVTYNDLL